MESALISAVGEALGSAVRRHHPVHGGDVAQAYRVDLADGRRVFVKSHRRPPPGFFVTEAEGLRWLEQARAVPVAEVLAVADSGGSGGSGPGGSGPGDSGSGGSGPGDSGAGDSGPGGSGPVAFLALAWIDEGPPGPDTDAELGRALAALHRAGAPCFGRADRRPTGSRSLPNDPCGTWAEFYRSRRLLPLARLAAEAEALPVADVAALEGLARELERFGEPAEGPSRLHGDLWAGNRLIDTAGRSHLIDPAAHGGHREFDLAMMRLFGGFGPECFAAYAEAFPLAEGWQDRVALHQMAPLVTHAIKFGGGYRQAASAAIARYR